MADPVFDITICRQSSDSRVLVNGEDVTRSIRRIRIEQEAGECPSVHLELVGTAAAVRVSAALDREAVTLQVPTVDVTPLGVDSEMKTVLP